MIKVTDAVKDILDASEVARTALSSGLLNLSAYAASIREEVELKCRKPVRTGTIVVALSRQARSMASQEPLVPRSIVIHNLAVKTGLIDITYDKTKANRDRLQRLYQDNEFLSADFFTVTFGVSELSIIVPDHLKKPVLKHYSSQKPKAVIESLVSLTVRFDEKYISIPNVIFALCRPLALKRINIVEIVSTFSELTFILHQDDLKEAFITLSSVVRAQTK